jgi:serine/threonine protein kinase
MAPEVALSEPYGLSADIYSFGIVMWEMLALQNAFGRMAVDAHRELVVQGEERPEINPEWTTSLLHLLKGCWASDPLRRPEAKDVHKMLQNEIHEMLVREFPMQAKP